MFRNFSFLFFVLFFLFALFVSSTESACPSGSFAAGNDVCLLAGTTATPFIYAESGCSLAGGHLSSISTAFDNQMIRGYVASRSSQPFLIGLQRNAQGKWIWSDGAPAEYLNFDSVNGQPGNDSCVLMDQLSGKWKTTGCHTTNPFVCTLPTLSQMPSCPSTWTYYQPTRSCYFKGRMQSWLGAEKDCVTRGAHLASIHSKDEADFVTGLAQIDASCLFCSQLRQRYRMWIGAQTVNGAWAWTDGTPYDYSPYGLPADRQYYLMVNTDSDCRDDPQSAYGNWLISVQIDALNDFYVCKMAAIV